MILEFGDCKADWPKIAPRPAQTGIAAVQGSKNSGYRAQKLPGGGVILSGEIPSQCSPWPDKTRHPGKSSPPNWVGGLAAHGEFV